MQLKRYKGKEVPEVLRQVRGDLGDDAVILHTREARPWGPLRFLGGAQVEVLAAPGSAARKSPEVESSEIPAADGNRRGVSGRGVRGGTSPLGSINTGVAPPDSEKIQALAAEIAELRALLIHFGAARLLHPSIAPYQHRLIAAGVDESVAFGLVRSLPEPSPGDTPTVEILRAALEQHIIATLPTSTDGRLPETGVLAFVGPSGSGKTTTLAKLAGQAALAGRKTAVITTDGERLGAVGQLEAFCSIAGIDCTLALAPDTLARAMERHGPGDLVLIDTPGLAVGDAVGLRRLQHLLAVIAPLGSPSAAPRMGIDASLGSPSAAPRTGFNASLGSPSAAPRTAIRPVSIHLVLSAPSKAPDALGAVRAFAPVGVTELLFTRLDETVTPGSLVTITAGATLPLSYVGTGTDVPGDIHPASARDIARRILGVRGAAEGEPSEKNPK
jgi:flagellar biosynthesis protein FlhF